MEETNFKIEKHKRFEFENDLESIFKENDTDCYQREFDILTDCLEYKVPKYCLENCTKEQIDLLNSYLI